ncbi:MAG: hypothetical protein JJ975_05975 [Bacteroidia bacterium]|nr:hypothetical protein [Bacteroidia bacterium]
MKNNLPQLTRVTNGAIKSIVTIFIGLLSLGAYAQDSIYYFTSAFNPSHNSFILDTTVDHILERKREVLFQKIVTRRLVGQTGTSNSFASLSTTDEFAKLSGTFIIKDSITNLSVNASGGATEGLITFLQGDEVNPNLRSGLTINFGYKFLNRRPTNWKTKYWIAKNKRDTTSYWNTDSISGLNAIRRLDSLVRNERVALLAGSNNWQDSLIKSKIIDNRIAIANAMKQLKVIEDSIKRISTDNRRGAGYVLSDDSLASMIMYKKRADKVSEIKNLTINDSNLIHYRKWIKNDKDFKRRVANIRDHYNKLYQKTLNSMEINAFRVRWWSFESQYVNRGFKYWNGLLPFDEQISKETFHGWELGLRFNRFIYKRSARVLWDNSAKTSSYMGVRGSFLRQDNFEDLTKSKVTDIDTFIASDGTIREHRKESTVYYNSTKGYIQNFWSFRLDVDLYWYPLASGTVGFHMKPETIFRLGTEPRHSLTGGIVVPFKNEDKTKDWINTEFFVTWPDIFGVNDEGDKSKFSEVVRIGLQLNVPIFQSLSGGQVGS